VRPRRVILSRKGLDAAWGGCASPILPDGTLVPLPIPEPAGGRRAAERGPSAPPGVRYADLRVPGSHRSAAALLRALGRDAVEHPSAGYRGERGATVRVPLRRARAHLDPDLRSDTVAEREPAWRPTFGQVGGAQSHLAARGVGPGDLFLFFGWFRGTAPAGGRRLRWAGPDLHVLWGWLEVGEVVPVDAATDLGWSHPHLDGRHLDRYATGNTLYLAADRLSLHPALPGAGTFQRLTPALRLTAEGTTRSVWDLPADLHPTRTPEPLSWHSPARWSPIGDDRCRLRTVRGQEFVVGATPGVERWAAQVLTGAAPPARP
jgi:hypothetical protein